MRDMSDPRPSENQAMPLPAGLPSTSSSSPPPLPPAAACPSALRGIFPMLVKYRLVGLVPTPAAGLEVEGVRYRPHSGGSRGGRRR